MSEQTVLVIHDDGSQWLIDYTVLDPDGNPLVIPLLNNEE